MQYTSHDMDISNTGYASTTWEKYLAIIPSASGTLIKLKGGECEHVGSR